MPSRRSVPPREPFEHLEGFSRAVRVGPFVAVGAVAPVGPDGTTIGVGNPAEQAERCFEIIEQSLEAAGAALDDIVRTRIYVKHYDDVDAVLEVRKQYVGHVEPADTILEVGRFFDPSWLVQIEVDAVVADDGAWGTTPDGHS